MKICLLLQARMGSERLPGKVMRPVCGKPLLEHEWERLRRVRRADHLTVITSVEPADDRIEEFCRRRSIDVHRGPERDVLARTHEAARLRKADAVIRVTGDCPLIDPGVIDELVEFFTPARAPYDYASNTRPRMYPRGLDCEIFTRRALEEAHREALRPEEREHVTPFLYNHPERFRIGNLGSREGDWSRHRWTVDVEEDLVLVEKIIQSLYPRNPDYSWKDVLALVDAHPDWARINAHVPQKSGHAAQGDGD